MSYDFTIILLLLFMIPINSMIVIFVYRQGLKDFVAKEEKKELKPMLFNNNKPKPKLTEEQKRLNTLLENVNNYKGNGVGQREVK